MIVLKPEISEIECFLAVAKYLSFTAAAKELHFSQQAVSRIIRTLEQKAGVELFSRSRRTPELTPYGRYFLPRAKKVYHEYCVNMKQMDVYIAHYENSIRIGIPMGITGELLRRPLARFTEGSPDTAVHVAQFDDTALSDALIHGEIDVGIFAGPVSVQDFEVHCTLRGKTCYMVSEKHPLASREVLSLSELAGERFIGFGKAARGHLGLNRLARERSFDAKLYAEVCDMQLAEELVRENRGIGFCTLLPDSDPPQYAGIRLIPDTDSLWDWELNIVTGRQHALREIDRLLIQEWKRMGR